MMHDRSHFRADSFSLEAGSPNTVCLTVAPICLITKNCKKGENNKKDLAVHVWPIPPALSPLSVECQGWQGQHGWQGYRGGMERARVTHGPAPVGFHHWGFGGSTVHVCGADFCATAATAWATALITCDTMTKHKPDAHHWNSHISRQFSPDCTNLKPLV